MLNSLQKGEVLFANGKIVEAEKEFLEVLKVEPENHDALNNMGVISFYQGHLGQAAKFFSRAFEVCPSDPNSVINLCSALKADGSLYKVRELLKNLSDRYPDNTEIKCLLSEAELAKPTETLDNQLQKAKALLAEGEIGEAEKCLRAVIDSAPQNKTAKFQLGFIAHRKGNVTEAVELFSEVLILDLHCKEAAQYIFETLKNKSQKEIVGSSNYAFAYTLACLSDRAFERLDIVFMSQAVSILSESHKVALLTAIVDNTIVGGEKTAIQLLNGIGHIESDLIAKLGKWMDIIVADRSLRDAIEMAICLKSSDGLSVREIARRVSAHQPDSVVVPGFETYPRRLVNPISSSDPFMKLVPENAPSKKHGMRVLILSDFNIAGQQTRLMRALNKYSPHIARCAILQEDYLSYDRDLIIRDINGTVSKTSMDEMIDLIKKADFFHIARGLKPIPGIRWEQFISPRNTVFQYHGSELRNNGKNISDFHARTGFEAITCVDWSIYKQLKGSFYHMHPCMLEIDELPSKPHDFSGKIRICHAPSGENYKRIKRTDLVMDVINRLAKENPEVEAVLIEKMKNKDCLELKSNCHVHIASLLMAFGLNAIESAAMGVIPITTLDNFSRFIFYDTPVVHARKDNVYDVTSKLLADRNRMSELSDACQRWARTKFDAKTVVKQYVYLYDLIYHGLSIDYPDAFEN